MTKNGGGKANSLYRLTDAGFHVPPFVVFSEDEINDTSFVNETVSKNFSSGFVAVRSSANLEDGQEHSFAGIFETKLFVRIEDVQEAVQEVFLSKSSQHLQEYARLHSINLEHLHLNIIVQEMIDADVSGVAFGANPSKSYKEQFLVSSVFGLGEGLVSGELNADHYVYDKNKDSWTQEIADKEKQLVYTEGQLSYVNLEKGQWNASSLTDEQLVEIGKTLNSLEHLYGGPQDIEFCFREDVFYLLQSRPITTLREYSSHIIWDNSNIIESYPGITSPFTFSFILDIYRSVYENFALLLGVPKKQIRANAEVFSEMLGHIHGRVYYQLINWYKALAMLPMYSLNASFMEKMMGVSEPLGVDFELKRKPSRVMAYWLTLKTVFKIVRLNRRLPVLKKRFTSKVNSVIRKTHDLANFDRPVADIWKEYKTFKGLLINEWSPPLANDLLAMVYFGSLQKLCSKWLMDDNIHTELIIGKHTVKSVLPARLINEIVQQAIDENRLEEIKATDSTSIWSKCATNDLGKTGALIVSYIDQFGDRSVGELKLENTTFRQKPENFIDILKTYSNSEDITPFVSSVNEKELLHALPLFKRIVLRYFINKASETVADRENLRLDRTRAFGVVRRLICQVGDGFYHSGFIKDPQDIFLLKEDEIERIIELGRSADQIHAVINKRKQEHQEHLEIEHLPERVHQYDDELDIAYEHPDLPDQLTGIPCCPGEVTGNVRVLSDPQDVSSLNGDILVTTSTDPGWITIFRSASAILVERGSTLSHAAIVSREMGIPCIVGIKGLTQTLKSGDTVSMNGSTGLIKQKKDG